MSKNLSHTGQLRHDFWEHYSLRYSTAPIPNAYARAYLLLPLATKTGRLRLGLAIRQDEARVYVVGAEGEWAADARPKLDPHEAALQAALGPVPSKKSDPLHEWCVSTHLCDTRDRSNWDQMADWLEDKRQIYERVLLS